MMFNQRPILPKKAKAPPADEPVAPGVPKPEEEPSKEGSSGDDKPADKGEAATAADEAGDSDAVIVMATDRMSMGEGEKAGSRAIAGSLGRPLLDRLVGDMALDFDRDFADENPSRPLFLPAQPRMKEPAVELARTPVSPVPTQASITPDAEVAERRDARLLARYVPAPLPRSWSKAETRRAIAAMDVLNVAALKKKVETRRTAAGEEEVGDRRVKPKGPAKAAAGLTGWVDGLVLRGRAAAKVVAEETPLQEGMRHFEAGDHDRALPLLVAGLAANPFHVQGLSALARIHLANERGNEAVAVLTRAIRIDGRNHELYALLGEAHGSLDDFDAAVQAYQKAIALHPGFTDAHIKLGILYYGHQRPKEAIREFERAIALDRSAVLARYYLALICVDAGDLRRATTQIAWIKNIQPGYSAVYLLQASIFERLGDPASALAELASLMVIAPGQANIAFRMGKLQLGLKDREAALVSFQQAAALAPTMWESHFYCARLLDGYGRTADALKAYQKTLESNPQMWDAYWFMGKIHDAARAFPLALAAYGPIQQVGKYQAEARAARQRIEQLLLAIEASLAGTSPPEDRVKNG